MKKLYKSLLIPLAAMLWACSDNVIDDLSGTYNDVRRYTYVSEQTQQTDKLRKGLKCLHMVFTDDATNTFDLKVVSDEWILKPGSYTPVADVLEAPAANQYQGTIGNVLINSGLLEVSLVDNKYYISGIFTGTDNCRYVLNYRGAIEFVIGIDDPEPSGYTLSLKVDPVTITDYTTWQTTIIPGVSKYTLSVSDPSGNDAAFFEAINKENLTVSELVGTYTIAGSPSEPWLIDNGWLVPDYGMAGGAYIVAANGEKQYITGGKIIIESVQGITGETLYNFSGDALDFATMTGNSGKTSFSIKFSSYLEKTGTELKDLSFQSNVLEREVKYSVLLPKSYDGTKEFPVLYMLHGAAGSHNDWLDRGNLSSHTGSVETEMIIVSPQASFDGFDCFYTDNYADKGINYETFFITEFIPAIETMFKGNGKRGIGGLSMGGFGTLYYGLKYPDKFAGMYACSPALAIEGAGNIFDMIWVPGPSPITVEIGTEDFLYESVKGLNDAMQFSPLLADFTYIERSGAHDWAFWSACSPKIVSFFGERFSK